LPAPDGPSLQLDHLDGADGDRREATEVPRTARQHGIPASRPGHHGGVETSEALVRPRSSPAALARGSSRGSTKQALTTLGQASVGTATRLGQGRSRDDRDHAALGGLLPERPECPIVSLGGDQRTVSRVSPATSTSPDEARPR